MYSGCNENRHLDILQDLLKHGADPNAYDINGYTPLHHAILMGNECMVASLLKYGANPNSVSFNGDRPLAVIRNPRTDKHMRIIDMLIQHKSILTNKYEVNDIREKVELYGSKELAVKVREAMPKDQNECEKCVKTAVKTCPACGLAVYCSTTCQKLDWVFHKVTCKKNRAK
jgi:hypothetical protein